MEKLTKSNFESDIQKKAYAVLLAGGTGTRLWPVSRELYPKQLVNFIGEDSLVQRTIKRLTPLLGKDRITIVSGREHYHEIARHMEKIGLQPKGQIFSEPSGRNTAPAILLAVLNILKLQNDAVFCVFPADHVIKDVKIFNEKVETALKLADDGYIVTFGIKPNYPETGYGYIEGEDTLNQDMAGSGALKIKRFVEKPDKKTAREYIKAGNFFWNSGMFAFKGSVIINEFKTFQPLLYQKMENILSESRPLTKKVYEQLPNISIDYAIMENTTRGVVLPSDFGWSDIGSWKSLYDFLNKDDHRNVIDGDVIVNRTQGCFIMGQERLIATNHIENLVVVETPDSVFVSDIENSREVKSIVAKLKKAGRNEFHQHRTVHYNWGRSTLLEARKSYRVNRLIINTGSIFEPDPESLLVKLIMVVDGTATISVEDNIQTYKRGASVTINREIPVKIENRGETPLCIIEVGLGVIL